MSNVKLAVGGAFEEEASRQLIDAWHRAERGWGQWFPRSQNRDLGHPAKKHGRQASHMLKMYNISP